MKLLRTLISKPFSDLREESFLLVLANFFWIVCTIPGVLLLGAALESSNLLLWAGGIPVLLPAPFAVFGLFSLVYNTARRRPVGIKRYVDDTRRLWRQAYLWGGVNLLVLIVLLVNLKFYANPNSPLGQTAIAPLLTATLAALLVIWLMWQLFALPLYPRTQSPRLWPVLKQAATLMLANPAPTLIAAMLAMFFAGVGIWVLPIGLLFSAAMIALVANRAVAYALGEQPERD